MNTGKGAVLKRRGLRLDNRPAFSNQELVVLEKKKGTRKGEGEEA